MNHTIKTTLLCFLYLVCIMAGAKAQQASANTDTIKISRAQSIYVEIYGPGILLSGNYDTRFSNRRDGWGGRIGFGGASDGDFSVLTVPVQISYLLGKANKFFEVGAGATYYKYDNKEGDGGGYLPFNDGNGAVGTMTFGYRSQPAKHGFNFRGSFNIMFNDEIFWPYAGLSLGYTFK